MKLINATGERGLKIAKKHKSVLLDIHTWDRAMEAKYIVTGAKRDLPIEKTTATCAYLDQKIGNVFVRKKVAIRRLLPL